MGQMTTDQYLDQIQGKLMETLTKKKDAMPPDVQSPVTAEECNKCMKEWLEKRSGN